MCVCVEQTGFDLLVIRMVINLPQPSAISHCAKYNTVSLTSLIPLCRAPGPRQTMGPYTPTCLPNLYASHALHHSAVQIHFDMAPSTSIDIIKRRHLLGQTFRHIYLGTDLIACLQHWSHPSALIPSAACWFVCKLCLIGICNSVNILD